MAHDEEKFEEAIELRKQGMTQEDVAQKVRVSLRTVQRWFEKADLPRDVVKQAKVPDIERQLGKKPDIDPKDMQELIECVKDIFDAEWSIKYLENMNVPSRLAPELMLWHMKYLAPWGEDIPNLRYSPVNTALVYLVKLFDEYKDIPTNTAKKLAIDYVTAVADKNETMKQLVEFELRFEPWKSRQHKKAWQDYLKLQGVRRNG